MVKLNLLESSVDTLVLAGLVASLSAKVGVVNRAKLLIVDANVLGGYSN